MREKGVSVVGLFRVATFVFFFGMISALYFSSKEWNVTSPLTPAIQYATFVPFIGILALIILRHRHSIRLDGGAFFFILFIIYSFISSFWSIAPMRTAIASGLFGILSFGGAIVLGFSSYRRVFFQAAVMGAIGGLLVLALLLPMRERTFGFVTANLIGSIGLVAIVAAYFLESRKTSALVILGLTLIAFAESRAIFGATLIVIFFRLVRIYRLTSYPALFFSVYFAVILFFGSIFIEQFSGILTRVSSTLLGVSETLRTTDTFTGRVYMWDVGLQLFLDRPLLGYGFQTRSVATEDLSGFNAHSGMINALIDLGVIGVSLYLLFLISAVWSLMKLVFASENKMAWHHLIFILAMIPVMQIEPNYIAFMHPLTLIFGFCCTSPILFRSSPRELSIFSTALNESEFHDRRFLAK